MAAPTPVATGTYLAEGSGATAAFAVPAGVQANDVILVELYKENTAAVTPPTGFTELGHQAATGAQDHDTYVFWKRATGADSGTYSFSWSGSVWRTGFASLWRGCATTGTPVDVYNGATSGSTSVTASPAVAVTTTGADRLLVWFAGTWDSTTWTTPTGFTALAPSGAPSSRLTHGAYKTQAAAGASGSVTTTTTQSFTKTAHLVALLPIAGTVYAKTGGAASLRAGSGVRATSSATAYPKTGGAASVAAGSGGKLVGRTYDKAGSAAALCAGSGAKTVNASNPKTGGAVSLRAGSGAKTRTSATAHVKTGGAVRLCAGSGAKVRVAAALLPSDVLDLSYWHLTTPEDSGDGTAEQIDQPQLDSYESANFFVDDDGFVVCRAAVDGYSTSSASGATRMEFRQHRKGTYALAAMNPNSTGRWQMTITTRADPTSITGGSAPRKEMIIAQIHGAGDSPIPLILAAEYHVSPTRVRIYKNSPGFANPVTGITPDTPITIRIRVEGGSSGTGRLKLWVVIGQVSDLPALTAPQYDWPISDFTDQVGWYFKGGAYNKTSITSGSSGEAIAKVSFLEVLEPSDPDPTPGTTYSKTGGAASLRAGSGAKAVSSATIYAKAGGASAAAAGSGVAVRVAPAVFAKTGGAVAIAVGTGTDVLTAATVHTETGGASAVGAGSGTREHVLARSGSATTSSAGSGQRALARDRTGGAASSRSGSGAKAITSAVVYSKTGGAAATGTAAGGRDTSVVHARTGGAAIRSAAGGSLELDVPTVHAKAGGATTSCVGSGARTTRSSVIYSQTGGATASGSAGGARERVRVYSGGAVITALAEGRLRLIPAARHDRDGGAAGLLVGSGSAIVLTPPGHTKSGGASSSGTAAGVQDLDPADAISKTGGAAAIATAIGLFEVGEPAQLEKEGGAVAVLTGSARRRTGGRLRAGKPMVLGQLRAGLAVRR